MDRKVAETLVSELRRHNGLVTPDYDLFLNELVSIEVPESSKFYETLPDKQQIEEERGLLYFLSLRKVLRNKNAIDYQMPFWKKWSIAITSVSGIYSSNAFSRNLRANKTLIEMMARCKEPYSLLGKFHCYDPNPNKPTPISTQPVLVIPGAKDMKTIYDWEKVNTIDETEKLLGWLRIPIRIKPQQYSSR